MTRSALAALGLLAALLAATSPRADPARIEALQQEIDETREIAAEVASAAPRVQRENAEFRAALSAEARTLTEADISAPMLRLAGLDVGAVRSHHTTLNNGIEQRRAALGLLDEEIAGAAATLRAMPADALATLAAKAELQKLEESQALGLEVIADLRLLRNAEAERLALAEERLALLQSRVELSAIRDKSGFEKDPRALAMRAVISRLTRDSTELANQAAAIVPMSTDDRTRKRLLELQADDASARGTLRLADLDLLRAQSQIDFLGGLGRDLSIPVRVLRDGRLELDQLQAQLALRLGEIDEERQALEGRRELIRAPGVETDEVVASQLFSVQALADLLDFQQGDLGRLQEQVAATAGRLDTDLARRELRALGERRSLPVGAGQRALLSSELALLAPTTFDYWRGLAGDLIGRLGNSSGALLALLAGIIAALAAGVWWLHRTGLRWLVAQAPRNVLSLPIEALRRTLPALLPTAIWLVLAFGLGLDQRSAWLVAGLLVLWPLTSFVLRVDRRLAAATTQQAPPAGAWGRTALIAAAVVGAVVLVVRAAPMLPSFANVVGRAGFLSLALAAIGIGAVRTTLLEALREAPGISAAGRRVVEITSLAVPALLGLAAVAGLAGWVNLGWTIFAALGAILAATFLVLVLSGALGSVAALMKVRLGMRRRRDRRAIDAACRLAVILLTVVAAWVLADIYVRSSVAMAAFWVIVIFCALPFVLQPLQDLIASFLQINLDRRPDGSFSVLAICVDRGVRMLLIIAAVLGVAWILDFNLAALAYGDTLQTRLVRGAFNVALVALVADFVWHLAKTMIDQRLADEGEAEAPSEAHGEGGGRGASRIRTLLPLFRKFLMITLAVMVIMLVLSSLGVDIGPLLAGAGVVGLAIGFGAQTLVRDIVSGVFFLMDDAFRLGEYVDVGPVKGTVEHISIRSLRLRHHRGALHTIPFGEIAHLSNYSRDWVIMKLQFRVPYDTDVKKVKQIFKKIGAEMMADPEIGPNLLDAPKSQGVLEMDDSAMIMRAKFMAKPGEQFVIRRELYHKVQHEFEAAGMEFARRQVSVFVPPGGDPAAAAAAAAVAAAAEEEQASKKGVRAAE